MKYIRRYKTQNDYINDFVELRNLPIYATLIDDEDDMIGGDEQKKTVFMKTKTSDAWVGDILCWNQKEECWEIYNIKNYTDDESFNFDDWDTNLIPDSICVIPACHTDNNKARWLSLMSNPGYYETHGDQTGYQGCAFQKSSLLIDDLECFTLFNNISSSIEDSDVNCAAAYPVELCKLMFDSDKINKSIELLDPIYNTSIFLLKYIEDADDMYLQISIPSVYDKNEKNLLLLKNKEAFKYKNSSGELNPIYDMDGYKNCEILKKYVYNSSNLYESGFFTILDTCNNIRHIDGVPESDWYIPAAGECLYIITRLSFINHIIGMLYNSNANNADSIANYSFGSLYWSSTLYSADKMICFSFSFAYDSEKTGCAVPFYIKQY